MVPTVPATGDDDKKSSDDRKGEVSVEEKAADSSAASTTEQHDPYTNPHPDDKDLLPADAKRAFWVSAAIIIVIAVLIPIPLGSSTYIFSPGFFTAWVIISMVRA